MNIFSDLPENLKEEVFEVIASSNSLTIERIVSKGHTSPETGWYEQEKHEWVMVVKGHAILTFEDGEIELKSGDYVDIPAMRKHKVSWTDPEQETIWLVVHYS